MPALRNIRDGRRYKWDNAKFYLILLVVVGHFLVYYCENPASEYTYMRSLFVMIYSFHMPAFIFLSGMFARKSIVEKNYSKIARFLFLYLFMKGFYFVFDLIIGANPYLDLTDVSGVPWYAFAVFACSIFTVFLQRMRQSYVLFFALFLGCIAGYSDKIGDFLCLSRILVFYPFFLLGFYMDEDTLFDMTENRLAKIIAAGVLAVLIIVCLIFGNGVYAVRPLLTGRNPYSALTNPQMGGLYRIVYYVAVTLLIFSFLAAVTARRTFVTDMGKRSLQVYVLHYCFLSVWFTIGVNELLMKPLPGVWQLIYLLLAVAITFIFSAPILAKPFALLINGQTGKPAAHLRKMNADEDTNELDDEGFTDEGDDGIIE